VGANDMVGAYGERVAARHLADAGFVVLDRNWRCQYGEIDIVARDGPTLVFCEVKTRRSARFGDPAEAVGMAKAERLRRLALRWVEVSGLRDPDMRFDVLSVRPQPAGPATVEHLRGAF
jgi:putative endonuclease